MRINSQIMKTNNVQLIVHTIQQNAPISRSDLTRRVGLTTAAVIKLTNELMEAGILIQTGRADGTHGRRAVLLDINPGAFYALGAEVNTGKIHVGLSDFRGAILHSESVPITGRITPSEAVAQIAALSRKVLAAAGIPREKLLGLGLALPGPLDSRRGVMINPPNFPGWENVPICEMLQKSLNLPVCCDRETNAAALAEYVYGAAAGYKTAVVVSLFRLGVGGGIISGGNVLHGFCDGAGEIGHVTVDPAGPQCTCGSFGCLETMVSAAALVQKARQRYKLRLDGEAPPEDVDALTLEDVFSRSEQGDPICLHVVQEAAAHIAVALGSVINLYSPEAIVLAGPLVEMSAQLLDLLRKHVQTKPYPRHCAQIQVLPARFGDRTFVMGGAVLAMDAFLPARLARGGNLH